MQIEYTLTFDDFRAAQWLYNENRKWSMFSYVICVFLYPAISITGCILAAAVWLNGDHQGAGHVFWSFAPLIAFSALLLIYRSRQRRSNYAAIFKKSPSRTIKLSWDEEQITFAIAGKAESRYYWQGLEDFAEDRRIILIFSQPKLFTPIPREALTEDAIEFLRRRVGAKSMAQP